MLLLKDKNYNTIVSVDNSHIESATISHKLSEISRLECSIDVEKFKDIYIDDVMFIKVVSEDLKYTKVPRIFVVEEYNSEDNVVRFNCYDILKDFISHLTTHAECFIKYGASLLAYDLEYQFFKMGHNYIEGITQTQVMNREVPVNFKVDVLAGDYMNKNNKDVRILYKQDFSIKDMLDKIVSDNPSVVWESEYIEEVIEDENISDFDRVGLSVRLIDFGESYLKREMYEGKTLYFSNEEFDSLVVTRDTDIRPSAIFPRGAVVEVDKGDVVRTLEMGKIIASRTATTDDINEDEPDNEMRVYINNLEFKHEIHGFDSPKGDILITIPELTEKNGGIYKRTEIVTFDNITNPMDLAYAGYEYALTKLYPNRTYSLKMKDEIHNLGYTMCLVRESDKLQVETRIIGIDYNLLHLEDSDITLGAIYSKNELDMIKKLDRKIKVLRKTMNKKGDVFKGYIDVSKNASYDLEGNVFWGKDPDSDSSGITTYNQPLADGYKPTKSMRFNQYGIQSATRGTDGKWVWKTLLDYDGLSGSSIASGMVAQQFVEIGSKSKYQLGYNPSTKLEKADFDSWKSGEFTTYKTGVSNTISSINSDVSSINTSITDIYSKISVIGDGVPKGFDAYYRKTNGNYLVREHFFDKNFENITTKKSSTYDSFNFVEDSKYGRAIELLKKSTNYYNELNFYIETVPNFSLVKDETCYLSLSLKSTNPTNEMKILVIDSASGVNLLNTYVTPTTDWNTYSFNVTNRFTANVTNLRVKVLFESSTSAKFVSNNSIYVGRMVLSKDASITCDTIFSNSSSSSTTDNSAVVQEDLNSYKLSNDLRVQSVENVNTTQNTDISTLKTDVSNIKSLNTTQSTDISTLKTDVNNIKSLNTTQSTDISTLKTDVSNIKTLNTTQSTDITNVTNNFNSYKTSNDARVKAVEDVNNNQNGDIYIIKSDISSIKSLNNSQQSNIDSISNDYYAYKTSNDSRVKAIEDLDVVQSNDIRKLKDDTSLILGVKLPLINNDITNLGSRALNIENNLIETNNRVTILESTSNTYKLSNNDISVLNNISTINLLATEAQNSSSFISSNVSKGYSTFTVTIEKDREFMEVLRMRKQLTSSTDSNKNTGLYYKITSKAGTIIAPNETIYISIYVRGGLETNKIVPMIYGTDASTKTVKNYLNPSIIVTPGIQVITASYKNTGTVNIENPYINLWFAEANIYNNKQVNLYDYNIDIIRTFMSKYSNMDVTYIEKFIENDSFNKLDNQRLRAELKALNIAVK